MDGPSTPRSELLPPPQGTPEQRHDPRRGRRHDAARSFALVAILGTLASGAIATGVFFAIRSFVPERALDRATPIPETSSDLEELTVERVDPTRAGRRWEASDASFSFVLPRGAEPRSSTFDDGLWEMSSRGDAVQMTIYVSDRYHVGVDPMPLLIGVADGLARDGTELRRSPIQRHGRDGLGVVSRDDGYRWFIHLFASDGRLYEVSAGYAELLEDQAFRLRAAAFLESFRIHSDGAVAEAS